MSRVIASAVAVTALTLVVLTGLSFGAQKAIYGSTDGSVTLLVTGNPWWWDVRYEAPQPHLSFRTANEIHIPVGEPVQVKLEATDVIHSFWVPGLAGKRDLIPGQQNVIQIEADRPGLYRGQCAEFCGWQHAKMGLLVVAEGREEFEQWRAKQIAARDPPADPERQQGERVFLSSPCVMCHTVRGTPAGGTVGPDLTHIASRRYLAAGALTKTRGTLAAWIVDPQRVKPGANMPTIPLEPDNLNSLLSYLEGLQ